MGGLTEGGRAVFDRAREARQARHAAREKLQAGQGDMGLMLAGYGLTTAEIYYRMPDHRHVLNSFIWQDYDLAPDYPGLFDFIAFWQEEIEGPLHSVRFSHRKLITPGNWHNQVAEFRIE